MSRNCGLRRSPCNVLLVSPRFEDESFWNYLLPAKMLGARYPTSPLGLITLAALLPSDWDVRLVDRNTGDFDDDMMDWADLVMTGGMLFQQADCHKIIAYAQARGKLVAVGGPDATSSPHQYAEADFRVLGEAEGIIDEFVEAFRGGAVRGTFVAQKFEADVTKSPIPRFDLLKLEDYLFIGVQFSRGCPFTCEFCDIIELYGRVPRTKTAEQLLAELDYLYALGYRGHVDFVDDNLIGNKKAVRAFLPYLLSWQEAHGFPFRFSTEASINIADSDDLLDQMRASGFFALFVGIESPDPQTLVSMKKKQNTRRDIEASLQKIYDAGMFVTAGFILGFDAEQGSIADGMVDLIEGADLPVAMVGLLYALPNTQLTRRLTIEGRLFEGFDTHPEGSGDQCSRGLNFETKRPRRDVLVDYRDVLVRIYDPLAYCARVERLVQRVNWPRKREQDSAERQRRDHAVVAKQIVTCFPEWTGVLSTTLARSVKANPYAARQTVMLLALYLHLGPYARKVVSEIDSVIAQIDAGCFSAPPLMTREALKA